MKSPPVNWPAIPFIRILFPFIAGIMGYEWHSLFAALAIAGIATGTFILFHLLRRRQQYLLRQLPGSMVLVLMYTAGYFSMYHYDARKKKGWLGLHPSTFMIGQILTAPAKGKTYTQFHVVVSSVNNMGRWVPASGKLLVKTGIPPSNFRKSDILLICNQPSPLIDTNKNTSNYLSYLARQNITHQVRAGPDDLLVLERSTGPDLVSGARDRILAIMDLHFRDRNENAMAKALLVGLRADMDPGLTNAYINTGVIHVVAISGMHLALIYSIIALALKPMDRTQATRWIKTLLVIACLWAFAFLCGSSPSVIRSAVMFSFILSGELLGKDNNTGNTLAASAFLMLCFKPVLISDIGFQLSYAAVASLLMFNKSMAYIFQPDNRILYTAWNTIATSLSAQILTTPLSLFHFQQFPLLFILSNLVAVPVSGIILILLFIVCFLAPWQIVSIPVARITGAMIRFMNQRITDINHISFSSWKNIHISWYETLNIYIMIIALTLWLRSKK